jgi:hypothetical protein
MSIEAVKRDLLAARLQVVQFDDQGRLLDSCDTFLQIRHLRGEYIFDHFSRRIRRLLCP